MNNIPHSDGLYPDWDEFYLAVCDICDMIIKPQALEKHLASKHGINVLKTLPLPLQNGYHQNNHKHPPITNNTGHNRNINNSKIKPSVSLTQLEGQSPAVDSNTAVPNNNHHHNNNIATTAPTVPITNGITDTSKTSPNNDTTEQSNSSTVLSKCWGGKQSLDSSPKPASGTQPCYLMRMRYRGTKWRNTYDILKDVLF